MIEAQYFIKETLSRGYNFWTGVPCSFLKPLINYVIQSPDLTYVGAASEGEAVGIAMGAYLAGQKTVVICQNSGLGNTVNPLTSLNYPFRVPTLLIVTHRGAPNIKDEPQHVLMGKITEDLLNTMKIPWRVFPDNTNDIKSVLDEAENYINREQLPFALIMKKGAVAPYALMKNTGKANSRNHPEPEGEFIQPFEKRRSRYQVIKTIKELVTDNELIVATTGKTGRELFALGHKSNQIYIVGSMGCASAIGLGLSLCRKHRKIIVLDGDGAALMKLGVLATIGNYQPANLIHIILDNEAHESTGGQPTVSESIDFAETASACSYNAAYRCDTDDSIESTFKKALSAKGPVLLHIKVAVGSDPDLIRPDLTPVQVKEQFMKDITNEQNQ